MSRFSQPSRLGSLPHAPMAERRYNRFDAVLAGALGFLACMPYPALNVGNATAIQMGNVLSFMLLLPLLLVSWKRKMFYLAPLLLVPLCLSALKVEVWDGGDLSLSLKDVLLWTIAVMMLPVAQSYSPRYALAVLSGVAIATLIHVAVGLWQLAAFGDGQFPIPWFYVNQSFLSVQDNVDSIARYTQRPFGLFPEPSAMSSSLAPWVLIWFAQLMGIGHLRQQPARWQNVLFLLAATGGLCLIILSQSGHAAITIAVLALFGAVWLKRSRGTMGTYLRLFGVFGIVVPLTAWFAVASLSNRMGDGTAVGNSSWEERSQSLIDGFTIYSRGDFVTVLFGVGAGMISPQIKNLSGIEAVFSVLLSYVYETGLVGVLVLCWVGHCLARAWRGCGFDLTFAGVMAVWLVGITLTTSYQQLLSIWLTLGWLTVWPSLWLPARVLEPVASGQPGRAWQQPSREPVLHALAGRG